MKPDIISSLAIIKSTNIAGKKLGKLNTSNANGLADTGGANKMINAVETKTLSAIGSKNFPNEVTRLRFLAIAPSKKSVKDATVKINAEII